jgi:hypothetical protein
MFCRGSAFRHKVFGLNPHIAGATIVTGVVLWFTSALRSRFSDIPLLRLAALWLRVSIGVQLLLGVAVLWSRLYSRQSQQPSVSAAHSGDGDADRGVHLVRSAAASVVLTTLACYRLVRSLPARTGVVMGARQT